MKQPYNTTIYNTALYMRLSRDDENYGDSVSIETQRTILQQYAKEQGLHVVGEYVDDGWSGTNFERPDFQRMMDDVEAGKVNCIVTKDLSRFGREHVMMDYYLEFLFPEKRVRYIAVAENEDTEKGLSDFVPFKNLFNEWFAKDTSRKVKAAFKAKFATGQRIGAYAPIGYRKHPEIKNKLIIDEETRWIVEKIFDLAIHGKLVPQDPNDEPAIELLKRINPDFTPCDNGHYTFDVPSGWITTNLGSIFNVVSAKRILKSDWKHSGVPFYRAREIAKLSIYGLVDNELYISEEHYNSLKEKFPVPKASDIMISAVGTIGKCYIVKESDKFYYKDASVLCLCNDYQINTKYIYHIMRSEYMLKQMYDNSKGTTVDTITIEKAKQYILPLPPLAEQQRIVAKIEETFSIFDGIQNSLEA